MIEREVLSHYLKNLLDKKTLSDYAPNGLQIEGVSQIAQICTAVTASLEVIERAIDLQADALLVHHGLFWRGESMTIVGMKQKRIAALLKHGINLYAYHLPLDIHSELGNNVKIGQALYLKTMNAHCINQMDGLLWTGDFDTPKSVAELKAQLRSVFGRLPFHLEGGPQDIHSLAWCSGAAQDFIQDAASLGVDAYISGEMSERTYYQAKELGIHYFCCGHYATECFGIQSLGEHLAAHFQLTSVFLEEDNPV